MRAGYVPSIFRKAVSPALAMAFIAACSPERTITTCEFGVDPATLGCLASAAGDTGDTGEPDTTPPEADTPAVEPDLGTPDIPSVPDIPDIAVAEDAGPIGDEEKDAGPQDIRADGVCNPQVDDMNLRIGMPCTSHDQCETCYCYDEEYLSWGKGGTFRFCTIICDQGPGSSCSDYNLGGSIEEYKCVKFVQKQIDDYEMKADGVCLPLCQNVSDCEQYSDSYDTCGSTWQGLYVSGVDHCQIGPMD